MKGYQFFLEYPSKTEKNKASIRAGRLGNHDGNVVALVIPNLDNYSTSEMVSMARMNPEGFSSVFYHANSGVNFGGVSWDYLRERCKRISEKLAREIHPRLFERLDEDDS